MARKIIVSDLHVDTWDNRKFGTGTQKKTKLGHWCDFLDWCEGSGVDEFVINGDLLDAPPYEGNESFRDEIVCKAIERLLAYAAKRRLTYVYGNHDIGISGIRCLAGVGPGFLKAVSLVYPRYVLDAAPNKILVRHGHLYDPFIWLYMRDLTLRTYWKSHLHSFQWVQQRRDIKSGKSLAPPGVSAPTMIKIEETPNNNIFEAMKAAEEANPPTKKEMDYARKWLGWLGKGSKKWIRGIQNKVTNYWWRTAARKVLSEYFAKDNTAGKLTYCVMGHTHVPDDKEMSVRKNPCHYFNSGTWTGKGAALKHATYLDVDVNGKLWVQDWISDRYD